ncbi:DUF6133 family protein [Paenibacillus macerans]|uniref:DUF6133 family protein n=1 Tax=Paenibacillus macerans TaxID=44252 RepID=UPI002DB9DE5F|nr:DUF6133 family protein [Paenibacillus macerans]MEC0331998.1 DUF6133 family protein [Paenibacillus macerans]
MKQWLKAAKKKIAHSVTRTKQALGNRRGEGFVDTAVKILMGVVIGALVLAGLYLLFEDTILPTLSERIKAMFDYGESLR